MMRDVVSLAVIGAVLVLTGCAATDRLDRRGDEIVAAGQLFHTGTRVVTWLDANGYDAYAQRFLDPDARPASRPAADGVPYHYGVRKNMPDDVAVRIRTQGWTLQNLQDTVDQFVIHYDVCGTSRRCFEVLDARDLSVPFMLDVDGTVYQTLDLKERAWHAGTANDRSVGIEIANIGAYGSMKVLNEWYRLDESGWPVLNLPAVVEPNSVLTPGYVGRPARPELITGVINGHSLMQYDFTPEQYNALIKLTAELSRVFPKLRLDAPRDAAGLVRSDVMTMAEQKVYSGLLGHYHVTKQKTDPGPAFDWDRVLNGARAQARRL